MNDWPYHHDWLMHPVNKQPPPLRLDYPTECQTSTTSFLTAATLIYAIGAGITAAAGTRLALQLFLIERFKLYSFQLIRPLWSLTLLFIVTTSPYWHWVSCAPAAFLGCGSRISGSLSGIEPWFPVTRYHHGRPIPYHRKLIGQIFEWSIAGSRPMRFA
jgi:hypothetical protein